MSDLIDRQAAIDDIWTVSPLAPLDREWIDRWLRQLPPANNSEIPNGSDTISRQAVKDILDKYQLRYHIYPYVWDAINALPSALPEPMKIDLSRFSEDNWERIKKEWANTPITTIAAQPYTIIDGRLFITVDDIEQVDCVLVAEYKSKFCREFWMADADEPAQPERIKGHWIVKHGSDAPPTCDNCGYESRTIIKEVVDQNLKMIYCTAIYIKSNFCPNCGADMREVTE